VPVGETFRCREQRQSAHGSLERVSPTGSRFLTGFGVPSRPWVAPTANNQIAYSIINNHPYFIQNIKIDNDEHSARLEAAGLTLPLYY
jgi:hypothetical protein